MKKKKYQRPEIEVVYAEPSSLMDAWSIPIDENDPGIAPGDEDEIGAKQGGFFDDSDWGVDDFKTWSK